MDRNKSTISRELSRNTGKRGYRHKQANRLADERHQEKNKERLIECCTYDVNLSIALFTSFLIY
jgi:IS30 family transposase